MGKYPFDSAKIRETIPEQDMTYDDETGKVMAQTNCPQCSTSVEVPFQRVVRCPSCGTFFKLSMA